MDRNAGFKIVYSRGGQPLSNRQNYQRNCARVQKKNIWFENCKRPIISDQTVE